MPRTRDVLPILALCAAGFACGHDTVDRSSEPPSTGRLSLSFDHASEAGVPRDLLVAIAQVEDGLTLPARRELAADVHVPAAGPLMLRRGKFDSLARAAAIAHTTEHALRQDADAALDAGARVLAELGAETGARRGDLATWQQAIEELGGFADQAHRSSYSHRVYATLSRGGSFPGRDGETIVLPAHPELPIGLTIAIDTRVGLLANEPEFEGAEYFPTSCAGSKCATTREGEKVDKILVHDTEGPWEASVATLQNDPGKSTHYIIGQDGRIGQFIPESYTGYHAGNIVYNRQSIGLEHVGYAVGPYPQKQYDASVKLTTALADRYKIPKDRAHVVGHYQVPNGNKIAKDSAPCADSVKSCEGNLNYGGADHHVDPGVWEWATFMVRIGGTAKANDVTPVLNCSVDQKHAFRSKDGKVEVVVCKDGCTAQPAGKDDLCEITGPMLPDVPPPAPVDVDAGAPPVPSSPSAPVEAEPPASEPPSEADPLAADDSGDSGCNASSQRPSEGTILFVALGLGLAVLSRRRRR